MPDALLLVVREGVHWVHEERREPRLRERLRVTDGVFERGDEEALGLAGSGASRDDKGRPLGAQEVLDAGLVLAVHPAADLLAQAQRLATSYVHERSPVSVALMRQMMLRNSAADSPLQAHQVDSLAMFYTSRADGHEGVRAFLEKRPAQFTARASTDMPPFYPW